MEKSIVLQPTKHFVNKKVQTDANCSIQTTVLQIVRKILEIVSFDLVFDDECDELENYFSMLSKDDDRLLEEFKFELVGTFLGHIHTIYNVLNLNYLLFLYF